MGNSELIEIDFEKFEDEYKLVWTERKHHGSNSIVFEDDEKNRLILLKINSKNSNCISCIPVDSKLLHSNSIKMIEEEYGLKLIKVGE